MVPAPENTGDEFPDFENMTPEQQMAWLESLAKRQGAKSEEFLTDADLDVPVPENAVLDEPGYVPYSISERPDGARMSKNRGVVADEPVPSSRETSDSEVEQAIEEEPMAQLSGALFSDDVMVDATDIQETVATVEASPSEDSVLHGGAALDAPISDAFLTDASTGDAESEDPMMWLDSLSAQSGDDLDALFADLDNLTDADDASLAFLDSVAEADEKSDDGPIDTSEVSPAVASPSPEEFSAAPSMAEMPDHESELWAATELPESTPEEKYSELAEVLEADEAGETLDANDPLGGMDPMLFLESLAVRQGAHMEEMMTSADATIDEVSDDVVVDEPGYIPYDMITGDLVARDEDDDVSEVMNADEPLASPVPEQVAKVEAEIVTAYDSEVGDDDLDWLKALSDEDNILGDASAVDVEEALPLDILPPVRESETPAAPGQDDETDVVSEEELTAQGELAESSDNLEDPMSWLEALAAEPASDVADFLALDEDYSAVVADQDGSQVEDPLGTMLDDEIAAAQAAGTLSPSQELAWLQRQAAKLADVHEADEAVPRWESPESSSELPPAEPAVLPDWLVEMQQEESDVLELEQDAEDALELDGGIESLWEESEELKAEIPEAMPESELEAFLSGDETGEPDRLADALGDEYSRRQFGEESEPEWYSDAVAKVDNGKSEVSDDADEVEADETLAEAMPIEMPDWLKETVDEPEASSSDVPGWLTESVGETEIDWLDEPAVETETAAQAEVPVEQPEIPQGELFEQYQQRLQEDPDDYANRLALARTLRTSGQIAPSLDHYEVLIENAQLLEDVGTDLSVLTSEESSDPRSYRLLGDAFMRQGKLQNALDAYRNALNRL